MSANRSGRTAEDAIADVLRRSRCSFRRQVPRGLSIYATRVRADFVVDNLLQYPAGLVIESKWQDIPGTADEKWPYVVANIRAGAYQAPVLLVVYGGGYRPGAMDWLRTQIDGIDLIAVLSFEGLLSWLQRDVSVHVTSPTLPWTMRSNPAP